ncbi:MULTISPECIES: S8 family serine peptidase [Nostocales]|uniref:S8 family serine peptidase n=3 Tax=Nostocales TaxID=1161 RepID=A0A8S9SX33_9CYAN|nr:S8 family serine peptidase [Tolypothrix bouteillei]KAF3884307.1 S8 family serine peptidase [Tolypothrix bouteillei VB521301]
MLDGFDLSEQSNPDTGFNYSFVGLSSGSLQGLNDATAVRKFSGSSTDYADFLSIDGVFDDTDRPYMLSSSELSPLVAPDPGSVFSNAYNIGTLKGPQTFTDFVGYSDPVDIYRFNLSSHSSFNLSLNGLTGDADVELYNANGSLVEKSVNSSTNMEWLDGTLLAGTYYVKVFQYDSSISYRLGLSATSIANNTRTVLGTLDANQFTYKTGFSRTVISGNGNVDFGDGWKDLLNLSSIYSSTVTFSNASNGGGVLYNPGNGTRLFDAITLNDGSQILFEGIDRIVFADSHLNLSVLPNDPLFGQQWNLHMMGVQNAWRFTTGSNKVLIGIEDTGLAANRNGYIHDDLRTTTIFTPNFQDDVFSTSHGTAVQGIIAANSNNGLGIAGINWNSPVFNIDVLGGNRNDLSLSEATRSLIGHASQNGQRLVINMSLGYTGAFGQTNLDPELNQIVANNPNVLFLIAAGNDGDKGVSGLSYPATLAGLYSNAIAVGASWGTVDSYGYDATPGERINYSQYGPGLTLMGPSEVPTTRAYRLSNGTVGFDYYPSTYMGFNGTSAATPNVTGVASLVWSVNPNLNATQIKQILSETSYDLGGSGYDTVYGSGFINADAAVRRALAIYKGAV